MEIQLNIYIALVTTSAVINMFLCLYTFFRRSEIPHARTFILYTLSICIYLFGYTLGLASNAVEQNSVWTIVEYLGYSFSASLGLLLIMQYTGRTLSKKVTPFLFAIPIITLILVATNDFHQLFFWETWWYSDENSEPIVAMTEGYWYVVHEMFTFVCILWAFLILTSQWKNTKRMFRRQLIILILSQLIPILAYFFYLLALTPWGMNMIPVLMCLTSSMYLQAMISSRLLTVVPIAKESIFESIREGVIVLDSSKRLIDYNQSLKLMVPEFDHLMYGQHIDQIWNRLAGQPFPIDEKEGLQSDLYWQIEDHTVCYQVRTSYVYNKAGQIVGSLIMLIDMTEQRFLQEQLKQLAYYDGLTKIFNRTEFLHRGRTLLDDAISKEQPISFILMDIDYFKRINDTYGHDVGDQALIHVVSICNNELAQEMLFARYGGEEFVMALPNMTLEQGQQFAEQLRIALADRPLQVEGATIPLTSSFGVSSHRLPSDSLESLLRDADQALYESKRNGRNKVHAYVASIV